MQRSCPCAVLSPRRRSDAMHRSLRTQTSGGGEGRGGGGWTAREAALAFNAHGDPRARPLLFQRHSSSNDKSVPA